MKQGKTEAAGMKIPPSIAPQVASMEKYVLGRPLTLLERNAICVYLLNHPDATAVEAYYEMRG